MISICYIGTLFCWYWPDTNLILMILTWIAWGWPWLYLPRERTKRARSIYCPLRQSESPWLVELQWRIVELGIVGKARRTVLCRFNLNFSLQETWTTRALKSCSWSDRVFVAIVLQTRSVNKEKNKYISIEEERHKEKDNALQTKKIPFWF